jgi:SAM-dependent methyltransferase
MALPSIVDDGAADWVGLLYDDLLADMLLRRDPPEQEVAFLVRELGIGDGVRVLDQGCGIGSLAIPLGRAGAHMVGVDQSAAYVAEAREAAAAAGIAAEFHAADARGFLPGAPVQAAVSWWTSWGHAPDDAGNLAMLRRVAEALVPGGMFALDTMNVAGVLHGFQAETNLVRIVARLRGEVRLQRLSEVDAATGRLLKQWIYHLPDGRVVRHRSAMRLYMPWQVAAMLREAGFGDIRLLGSLEGEPVQIGSRRLIALARTLR